MHKAIVGIGIPGSGKTTALKQFADDYGYTYVSPDDIRKELTGNAIDQSKNKEVWHAVYERASEALKGATVVVDASFVKENERQAFVTFLKAQGADKVVGVFVDAPLDVAKERNAERERVVPEHAMNRMYIAVRQKPPALDDGFDSLFTLNEFQELTRAEVKAEQGSIVREMKGERMR